MQNLKMHTPIRADENYQKLAALFPNAVTETIDPVTGEVVRAIDKDILMQEISATVVDGHEERYQFTWPDKKKAILLANSPISKTLRPCREESVDFDNTENLYIEGDNLDVLKLLQETYLGKVKMIYIDPPYNTGNDFVYEDDFAESTEEYLAHSGQYDEDGNRLFKNMDTNGRFHTDWLNMMYPRLRLAKDLLTEDGVIFISIDDHEVDNLRKICDEIFGACNFVANISWQRTYSIRNDSKGIPTETEHLVAYSKHPGWMPYTLPRTAEMNSKYKNPDNDIALWRTDNAYAPGAATHQGMVYAIQHPFTGEMLYPAIGRCWSYGQDEMLDIMNGWCAYELKEIDDVHRRAVVCGVSDSEIRKGVKAIVLSESLEVSSAKAKSIYKRGQWPKYFFTKGGMGGIARKTYLDNVSGKLPTNFWSFSDVGHTDEAKKEIMNLFGGSAPFDTPKPTRLIERMLTIATDKDSLILDFFSGSATTAHAVMKKNAEDGGKRKFIMVQIPEESKSPDYANLCEIGKERIRRAGKKIIEEKEHLLSAYRAGVFQTGEAFAEFPTSESAESTQDKIRKNVIDTGFRVLKLDSSNMKDVYYTPSEMTMETLMGTIDNIKEDRTPEDLLFQVMLDLGVLLSSKIEESTIDGRKVFNVADGFLIACFDENVTEETIKAIAKQKPYYFVMRDSSMASDSVAVNFEQIFETYSPDTVRRVI